MARARVVCHGEGQMRQEYTSYYRDVDLARALVDCVAALNKNHKASGGGGGGAERAAASASSSAWSDGKQRRKLPPHLTVAIRTNGVEAENAAMCALQRVRERYMYHTHVRLLMCMACA